MSGKRRLLYYALTPVFERAPDAPPTIASAAVVTCIASGKVLAGMGGGGPALAPEIVDQLDMAKTGGRPRIVCDAELFESMLARLKEADTALLSCDNSAAPDVESQA